MLMKYVDQQEATKIYSKLKREGYSRLYMRINVPENTIKISAYKHGDNNPVNYILSVDIESYSHVQKLVIEIDDVLNVSFRMLMQNCFLDCFAKNLKGLKINDNSFDYWMDTVVIMNEKRTAKLKIDYICSEFSKMVYV